VTFNADFQPVNGNHPRGPNGAQKTNLVRSANCFKEGGDGVRGSLRISIDRRGGTAIWVSPRGKPSRVETPGRTGREERESAGSSKVRDSVSATPRPEGTVGQRATQV